mmetsp:Transcript_101621/g.265311  ORF Transcript_101621/g.265311 Transcript_101621/m.265311 type:complete len:203 (+) Transcript_101621:265-873(+)
MWRRHERRAPLLRLNFWQHRSPCTHRCSCFHRHRLWRLAARCRRYQCRRGGMRHSHHRSRRHWRVGAHTRWVLRVRYNRRWRAGMHQRLARCGRCQRLRSSWSHRRRGGLAAVVAASWPGEPISACSAGSAWLTRWPRLCRRRLLCRPWRPCRAGSQERGHPSPNSSTRRRRCCRLQPGRPWASMHWHHRWTSSAGSVGWPG